MGQQAIFLRVQASGNQYKLRRIGQQVAEIGVADREALDTGQFRESVGGFTRLNRIFGGGLDTLLGDINEEAWKESA